jgi:hypothetical protein
VRIHAVLGRKIRTEEEKNTEILIVSIYCERARARGRQYTKRILPVFVIPGCNITLENVLLYLGRHAEGEAIDYEEASYLLGSYDNRTIRRHVEAAWVMIGEVEQRASARPASLRLAAEPIVVIHMMYVEFAGGAILRRAGSSLNRDGLAAATCDTS